MGAKMTPARFWAKVDSSAGVDACWPWTGYCNSCGYGYIGGANARRAHRVAYELAVGPITEGLHVCHSCDNRPCCNPAHLWLGTNDDNVRDMLSKGRLNSVRGERHGLAKLTAADVIELRRLHRTGRFTFVDLGPRFGVVPRAARDAILGITWRHVAT